MKIPGIKVSFENGKLSKYNEASIYGSRSGDSSGDSLGGRSSSQDYFYLYDGHFYYGDYQEANDFVIYEVIE